MGKNVKTYVLLAVVLVIWGIIAIRIFSAISPETGKEQVTSQASFAPLKVIAPDTFSIKADYRDPFLGTYRASTATVVKPKRTLKKEMPAIAIQYTGSMVNNSTKKHIYFVTINGQQHLLEKGKTAGDVTLIRGSEKAITIRYQGFTKRVALQQ